MNPPYRVLARVGRKKEAIWFHWRETVSHFVHPDFHNRWYDAADLKPVDHPKNDPEAIKIIEQAQLTRAGAVARNRP